MTQVVGHLIRTHYPNLNKIRKEALEVNASYQPPLTTGEVETTINSIYDAEQNKRGTKKENKCKSEYKGDNFKPEIFTAFQLEKEDLPETTWIVEGLVTEDCNGLVGNPKSGKSLMCIDIAIAVATGGYALGKRKAEKGDVLYMAMEDTKRSLKERLHRILQCRSMPKKLYLATEFPKIDKGGLGFINEWLDKHPKAKLVIIDTLQKIRPATGIKNSTLYADDYEFITHLKKISDTRKIAIIGVHHKRKMKADDILDTVSGSSAITGALDSIIILTKNRGRSDAQLFMTGRNREEESLALEFNRDTLQWTIIGDAEEYCMSRERAEILKALKDNDEPMSAKVIAKKLKKKEAGIRQLLYKMSNDDQLKKIDRGLYINNIDNKDNNNNIGNNDNNGNKPVEKVTTSNGGNKTSNNNNKCKSLKNKKKAGCVTDVIDVIDADCNDDCEKCEKEECLY